MPTDLTYAAKDRIIVKFGNFKPPSDMEPNEYIIHFHDINNGYRKVCTEWYEITEDAVNKLIEYKFGIPEEIGTLKRL